MDKPISLVLSIALAVAGMIAVGSSCGPRSPVPRRTSKISTRTAGITTKAVCDAAGGTWTAAATGDKCT